MSAEQLLSEGRLEEALARLQDEVRADPANPKHRVFLFQLLAVLGEWERALTQLNVVSETDPSGKLMAAMYGPALQAEALRAEVFAGKRSPVLFGEPEEWMASMVQAFQLEGQGRIAEAQSLREKAFEAAPAMSGQIDGRAFKWIADADTRMGPMIEAIVNGAYYWIPFARIHQIQIEEPTDLRDAVWAPATVVWANGGEAFALIPVRYPGSEQSEDSLIRLSRKTDWEDVGNGIQRGLGQRLFATDEDDFPILSIRRVIMDNEVQKSGPAPGEPPSVELTSG